MSLLNEQPNPVTGTGDVWAEVLATTSHPGLRALFQERREQGVERYGTTLQRDNGRDHYADAVQELVDAVVYLQAARMMWARRMVEGTLLRLLEGER